MATSIYNSGVNQVYPDLDRYDWANGEKHKIGITWAANDAANCFDGGTVDTDTSVTLPATPIDGAVIGNGNGIFAIKSAINGYIRKVDYGQTRRDNTTLQANTTI